MKNLESRLLFISILFFVSFSGAVLSRTDSVSGALSTEDNDDVFLSEASSSALDQTQTCNIPISVPKSKHLVTNYLRLYPSASQARINSTRHEDIVTALSANGQHYVYANGAVSAEDKAFEIVLPIWIATSLVDVENQTTRTGTAYTVGRKYNPDNPTDLSRSASSGFLLGANNLPLIDIGCTEGVFTLVFISGYVYRTNQMPTYLEPVTREHELVCDPTIFETNRTDGTIYLSRDTNLDRSIVFEPDDGSANDNIHELIFNSDTGQWHTAIWIGSGRSGKLHVSGESDSADSCEFALPSYPQQTKPEYTTVIVANPQNIGEKIQQVNELNSNVELQLEPGEYFAGDFTVTANNVNMVALEPNTAVLNGEWVGNAQFTRYQDTDVFMSDEVPDEVHQIHADFGLIGTDTSQEFNFKDTSNLPEAVERLPSVSADPNNREWNIQSLDNSPNGGWFFKPEEGGLFVKMPDGSDPSEKLHLSGSLQYAFDFSGNNVWVEGLTIKFYGKRADLPIVAAAYNYFSGMRFTGNGINVRNNIFSFNRGHALSFGCDDDPDDAQDEDLDGIGCATDINTIGNLFLDNQNYLTYRQARLANLSGQDKDLSLLPSNRVLYWKTTGFTHRGNEHIGSQQGIRLMGAIAGDVMGNYLMKMRNIPIVVTDAQTIKDSKRELVPGHSLTIARNKYNKVGWSLPSNEDNATTGPVWWINNCVMDYGWPGNAYNNDTIRGLAANRYGGGAKKPDEEPGELGIQLVYNNVITTSQYHPSFGDYYGWKSDSKVFKLTSEFYNNVWYVTEPNTASIKWAWVDAVFPGKASVLQSTIWDHNQYWISPGLYEIFVGNTLTQYQKIYPSFEINGGVTDPGSISTECVVENPLPHKLISGVTGNQFLFD